MADLALRVELSRWRLPLQRDLKRGKSRKDRDVRKVLRRDGSVLLRVPQQTNRLFESIDRFLPALLELRSVADEDFLLQGSIWSAHRPLLAGQKVVKVLG